MLFSGTPGTYLSPPSLAHHRARGRVRASSKVEEASLGFAPCQQRGGKGGGCRLSGGFALRLCLEPGFPAKARGFPLGCLHAGEEGFPSLRRACGERSCWRREGGADGGAWKSIGSLRRALAAGTPTGACARKSGVGMVVGRSSGRSATCHPLNSTPYPEVKVRLSRELFLHFIIYILAWEL